MTDAATLHALARRIETASEGSRELDADIYEALGYRIVRLPTEVRAIAYRYYQNDRWQVMRDYTTSLDAALKLAQPPCHGLWTYSIEGRLDHGAPDHHWFKAEITVPSIEFQAFGPTAALAMSAASCRMLADLRIALFTDLHPPIPRNFSPSPSTGDCALDPDNRA